MAVGIMGAMPEEVAIIKSQMEGVDSVQVGNREYHVGTIDGVAVVLVFSRWGKVAAATTAATLISTFDVNQLIFTGVAGAVSKQLNVGDIVISQAAFQHDMDAQPLFAKGEIPLTGITCFQADSQLTDSAQQASAESIESIKQSLGNEVLSSFTISKPKCLIGLMASGDQFISADSQLAAILSDQPDTLVVDMESAAVAQVCHDYQVPFTVIRVVSDCADAKADMDFLSFIKEVARHYSDHIIRNLFNNKVAWLNN